MVKISMETFVRRFQPDKYENWLEGKGERARLYSYIIPITHGVFLDWGEHPEEPGKMTLAPKPILNKKLML
jgi:jumonji domain-containing protein 2